MVRAKLEIKFLLAILILFVVSNALVLPTIFYPPIWKLQNRTVDWLDQWAIIPYHDYRYGSDDGSTAT